jgi:hypothetical protein
MEDCCGRLLLQPVGQENVQQQAGAPCLHHQPILANVEGEVAAAAHARQHHGGGEQARRLRVILDCKGEIRCRDAPDTDFAGYPANLKAKYRKSGRIINSTFKCLVKYETYIDTRCNESFVVPYLKIAFLHVSASFQMFLEIE